METIKRKFDPFESLVSYDPSATKPYLIITVAWDDMAGRFWDTVVRDIETEAGAEEILANEKNKVLETITKQIQKGETITTFNVNLYNALCDTLEQKGIDYVSGDYNPKHPDEPCYVELNG